MMPPLILASSSPRRRELLAALGLRFTLARPDIDETQHSGEAPTAYVLRLSREKAAAVAARTAPPALILAADTTVVLDEAVLGKPGDATEARAMLLALRGRAHRVCTALTLALIAPGQPAHFTSAHDDTIVIMRDYSETEMESYIASGDPFDKAGGYAIQHAGFRPAARIEGSHTNVVGLPLELLRRMLAEAGYPLPEGE